MELLLLNSSEDVLLSWQSGPRFSFSQDLDVLSRSSSPRAEVSYRENEDLSSDFEFVPSVQLDLQHEHEMLSADELFSGGKLRLLEECTCIEKERDQRHVLSSLSLDNTDEMADAVVHQPMACHAMGSSDDLHCISLSVDRTRRHPPRQCTSLMNSRCSSPSRSSVLPSTTLGSPKASTARQPSKFKDFFRLRKAQIQTGREILASTLSASVLSAPAQISRESGVSSSCRLPFSKRSFWPFSRSNSAGESKSRQSVSPPPRRSNSAGESKTSSFCLLPFSESIAPEGAKLGPKAETHQQPTKKCVPPVSNIATVKKHAESQSFRLSVSDVAAPLSSQSIPASLSMPALRPADMSTSSGRLRGKHSPSLSSGSVSDRICESRVAEIGDNIMCHHGAKQAGVKGCSRRFSSDDATCNMWDSPCRTRFSGATRSNRNSGNSKGLVRSKDMMFRDTASVQVAPVLNVPGFITPSLRGVKSVSMQGAKPFSLGNIFSKKDKTVLLGAAAWTPVVSKQNGA